MKKLCMHRHGNNPVWQSSKISWYDRTIELLIEKITKSTKKYPNRDKCDKRIQQRQNKRQEIFEIFRKNSSVVDGKKDRNRDNSPHNPTDKRHSSFLDREYSQWMGNKIRKIIDKHMPQSTSYHYSDHNRENQFIYMLCQQSIDQRILLKPSSLLPLYKPPITCHKRKHIHNTISIYMQRSDRKCYHKKQNKE